jgi:hypothetical protein
MEKALISQAGPHMFAAKARAIVGEEIEKGCRKDISAQPVSLEPVFNPIMGTRDLITADTQPKWIIETPPREQDLIRLQVWISPEQKFDWNRSELFLKQLYPVSHRVGLEICGNNKAITIAILCHQYDQPIINAAFSGEFERCELSYLANDTLVNIPIKNWDNLFFYDCFPSPPYSHLLTRPDELRTSPYEPLISAMTQIPDPAIGIFQALLQPVAPTHDWHRNVQVLLDLEYAIKLTAGLQLPMRYAQQAPSGDLKQMAWEVENKAHNDKPFYGMAFRVAVVGAGTNGKNTLRSLSTFSCLFQHGGRPLNYLTEEDFAPFLSQKQIRDMFVLGLTHRPGFLVNSWELAGPVHIPPAKIFDFRLIPLETLETLPPRNTDLLKGTKIGTCNYAGKSQKVGIIPEIRKCHTHLIGKTGTGKSSTLEHMVLDDIKKGNGVAVLDPHGDLVERLICLLPERFIDRTIYFNPGDPDWIPIWNPLDRIPGQDIGRTANDIVRAIQSFVSVGGWGDRLEHLLRNIIFSLIQMSGGTFLDLSNLLRHSEESKRFRNEILHVIDNEAVRRFWLHDFEKYGKDDFGPPKNKLSKLLVSGSVSLMLSQRDSLFNFRKIMDRGMILFANLSTVGPLIREILGCFMLSLFHLAAVSRSDTPIKKRKQFHIYCDEAHRFVTDALEDLIVETRKYSVSLILAHQYMSQFGQRKTDAISSVGSTIIFNVDRKDAQFFKKDLRDLVKVDDLISLGVGEAIARIGTDIVRVKTAEPYKIKAKNFRDRIIEQSRRRYYRPTHEVRKAIRRRGDRWNSPFSPLNPDPLENDCSGESEEFVYDEF